MSKRLYIATILGTGSEEDMHRPAVAEYPGVSFAGSFDPHVDGPLAGQPKKPWMLVIVSTNDHAPLIADPRIDPLPDFPFDGKVSAINTVTRNAMLAAMTARGIDTSFIDNTDSYRAVIQHIGKEVNTGFDENSFDVN